MSIDYDQREGQQRFEYSVLILLSTLGMLMLISAADLIALYLGLELMSLPLYVVAASHRDFAALDRGGPQIFRARRAVLGHAALRRLADLRLHRHRELCRHRQVGCACRGIGLIFGLVFLFAGFCFKVSAVPFHMWTPDVYEGAPTPVTAFFAAAPKVAGIAMFVRADGRGLSRHHRAMAGDRRLRRHRLDAARLLRRDRPAQHQAADGLFVDRPHGLCADRPRRRHVRRRAGRAGLYGDLRHHDARRLRRDPVDAAKRAAWSRSIDQLAGLARTHPTMAFFLAMLLFSMAGVPPLAGFFAKFYVFLAAIKAGLYVLAVIGVLASVVGAYYYLAIVKIMYFDEPAEGFYRHAGRAQESCSRFAACSTFCSSSIRGRSSASPARPPIRCSDAASFGGDGGRLSPGRA